jgi:hypothetical protein
MSAQMILPDGHDAPANNLDKSNGSISSEGKLDQDFLFDSALDVGSKFIKIHPENELLFHQKDGVFVAEFNIQNTTTTSNMAYYVSGLVLQLFRSGLRSRTGSPSFPSKALSLLVSSRKSN